MARPIEDLTSNTVCAYLDEDVARRLRFYAKQTGRSMSGVITEALRGYFARLDLIESIDHDTLLQQLAAVAAEQIAAERGEI